MTDYRQDRSKKFENPPPERGNPHGGHGRRVEHNLEEEFVTHTGHPLGEGPQGGRGDELQADMPPDTDLTHGQHSRKGQAQSPRELNLNQPEKKREGHGH